MKDVETTVDATAAESSAADATQQSPVVDATQEQPAGGTFEHVDLDMTSAERSEWLAKGTVPERFMPTEDASDEQAGAKETKPAATSTSTAKGEEAGKSAPASEAGKQDKASDQAKATTPERGAEQRKAQLAKEISDLLAERKKLRLELDGLHKGEAAPTAAAQPIVKPQTAEAALPQKPKDTDYKTLAELDAANDKYWTDLLALERQKTDKAIAEATQKAIEAERKEREKTTEQQKIDEYNKQTEESWKKKLEVAGKRHPEDFLASVFADGLPINPTMDSYIMRSEHGAEMLYRLGKDFVAGGDMAAKIYALDAYETMEQLVALRNEVIEELKPKDTKPVLPRVTKTPIDLGGRNTAPVDEADAALDTGDFTKYRQVMNKREREKATAQ